VNGLKIQTVIEYLNRTKKYAIPPAHYDRITEWKAWWKGFYEPFHEFIELDGTQCVKRKLYTLKMAKKVCEDWASILLNEKTEIVISDGSEKKDADGKPMRVFPLFLRGRTGPAACLEKLILGPRNELVEKAFAMGAGRICSQTGGMQLQGETF
jgi:hypothetical protein